VIEPTDEMIAAFERDGTGGWGDITDTRAGLAAVLAIVERDRKARIAEAAAAQRPTQEMLDAYADVSPSGQVSVWGVMAVLAIVERDRAAEMAEFRALFQLQWTRSRDADARWRAEDPEARANVWPDLGVLLKWLMDDADQARAELAIVGRDRCMERRGHVYHPLARKWPSGRGGSHPHYCVSCSDGEVQGPGCDSCRSTGMDQTPWPRCEECRS